MKKVVADKYITLDMDYIVKVDKRIRYRFTQTHEIAYFGMKTGSKTKDIVDGYIKQQMKEYKILFRRQFADREVEIYNKLPKKTTSYGKLKI